MFLLKAEPWRSLGTHSELGIRYTVWKSCSFHCKDNDLPLQRLLKENKCYHQKHFDYISSILVFFFWKTVKLVATYLKRKHIAKPFALSYSLMSFIFGRECDLDEIFLNDFTSYHQNQHARNITFWDDLRSVVPYNKNKASAIRYCYMISLTCFWKRK